MPTANKRLPIDYDPSELEQIKAIAEALGLSVTQFIRLAVRKEIANLGHVPSSYEYKTGIRKNKG